LAEEMRTEKLKKNILLMFGSKDFYGYEAHKALISKDVKIGISHLYQVLNEMLKEGLLDSKWEKSQSGPNKKIYKIGKKGRIERKKILLDAVTTIHKFYGEYLRNLPPDLNVLETFSNLIISKLEKMENIGFYASNRSKMLEVVMLKIHQKTPHTSVYYIKPSKMKTDLKYENLMILEGKYDDIPIKNSFLDLLVVMGIPEKDTLVSAVSEWQRLIKPRGIIALVSPTVIIQEYEDPITIGQFIEKQEHQYSNGVKKMGIESIKTILKRFFNKIEEHKIVHITIFLASEPNLLG
jgi:DNA-binding PadR family transcriptional regulator